MTMIRIRFIEYVLYKTKQYIDLGVSNNSFMIQFGFHSTPYNWISSEMHRMTFSVCHCYLGFSFLSRND